MNISDSQRIAYKLENLGFKSAPEKEADLIIVNACSVRQHAVDRIWGLIKKWQKNNKKIVTTGCVLKSDLQKLTQKKIEYFPILELKKLKPLLSRFRTAQYESKSEEKIERVLKSKSSKINKIAYVTIMTGCDNFCSYCVVPYTRGREKSRPMKDIVQDVKEALKRGHHEILLLGQNVNSYGIKNAKYPPAIVGEVSRLGKCQNDKGKSKINNTHFIKLLKTIDDLPGDFKFNFISSNPHDMGDELILCFSDLKKWTRELHLAMQSGDDDILHNMNRKYTSQYFLKLVNNLKSKIKNLKFSTDIIVGFPGESEKQFQNTVLICKKIGFEKAYISKYSPRAGTAAAKMKDDITIAEKKRRWQVLNKMIN